MRLVVHVTGARPNFPKVGPVMAALAARGVQQRLIHTGQHYDDKMSEIFFQQLNLPRPDVNLGVGSGSHAVQTANIMVALEQEFLRTTPSLVMVYGDINSTVAAALVAAKLHIPLAHVEAGLRSFDMTMPEEVNRRVTDQLSELLFVTSPEAVDHLTAEGLGSHEIHFVGNPMIDTLLSSLDKLDPARVRAEFALPERYAVATLHRPSNVDSADQVESLVRALHGVADELPIYIPLHLAVVAANNYQEGQTGGRGFIGLAAMLFGNWRPGGLLAGSALFGFADALQLRASSAIHAALLVVTLGLVVFAIVRLRQSKRIAAVCSFVAAVGIFLFWLRVPELPGQFVTMTPYVTTLLVLSLATQRLRMPAADGLPYRKGGAH